VNDETATLGAALAQVMQRIGGDDGELHDLRRLSGGANMQTWAFDWQHGGRREALILRRRPPGLDVSDAHFGGIDLATEAQLLLLARRQHVPVPTMRGVLQPGDALGEGFIMSRLEGEALPQRLFRDARYAVARERFAFQCGEALAAIHSVPLEDCPGELRDLDWEDDLARLQGLLDTFGNVSPVHQLALNTLRDLPAPGGERRLCHGDFRMGNLLLAEQGLAAVLDWELAHVGYPAEDLGYLCANVWRFGGAGPVGGLGEYQQLLDGYASGGGTPPGLEEIRRWELYAALGWGLVCLTMLEMYRSGADRSLERAAVGRRLGESEVDILLLLEDLA
jgi:aminoglycoside phosphotransferase (APT) family kinase protein